MSAHPLVVVMGVSGSGKSTVGRMIAQTLGVPFLDADDLHPEENLSKLTQGIPLTDQDREPWLDEVAARLAEARRAEAGPGLVVACSALKAAYRRRMMRAAPDVIFVHLHGSVDVLTRRLAARAGHFMSPLLLQSQLADLEHPTEHERAVMVDIDATLDDVVQASVTGIRSLG